ncbi:hypothetical protein PENSPDRAFT_444368 [Peniophora sp. CONT]|nr:hypothetical protein PENSPDRAFT_444368 [Peniophora sp. CONT]
MCVQDEAPWAEEETRTCVDIFFVAVGDKPACFRFAILINNLNRTTSYSKLPRPRPSQTIIVITKLHEFMHSYIFIRLARVMVITRNTRSSTNKGTEGRPSTYHEHTRPKLYMIQRTLQPSPPI